MTTEVQVIAAVPPIVVEVQTNIGPQGPAGEDGAPGPQGPAGADGSPDTAEQILTKLLTVDGNGSGLDSDTLDGLQSTAFALAYDKVPIGGIIEAPINFSNANYELCDGRYLAHASYPNLSEFINAPCGDFFEFVPTIYPKSGGITHDGDRYVVGVQFDLFYTSTNLHDIGTIYCGNLSGSATVYDLIYFNGLYIAALSSNKLISFPQNLLGSASTCISLLFYSLASNGTLCVAVGLSGIVYTSPDGITWTQQTSNCASSLFKVVYVNGLFVAIGVAGVIITSPDGITWTARVSGTANSLSGIAYSPELGLWCVSNITNTKVLTSPDAITWTLRDTVPSNATTAFYVINDVQWVNGRFIGMTGRAHIFVSSDGINWAIQRTSGLAQLTGNLINFNLSIFKIAKDNYVTSAAGSTSMGFSYSPVRKDGYYRLPMSDPQGQIRKFMRVS